MIDGNINTVINNDYQTKYDNGYENNVITVKINN